MICEMFFDMAPLARVSVTEMNEVNGRIALSNCYATFCPRKFRDYHPIPFLITSFTRSYVELCMRCGVRRKIGIAVPEEPQINK